MLRRGGGGVPREAPRAGAHREGLEAAQAGKLGLGFLRGSQARPASGAGEPCRQCLISLCSGPHRQEASFLVRFWNRQCAGRGAAGYPGRQTQRPQASPVAVSAPLAGSRLWGPLDACPGAGDVASSGSFLRKILLVLESAVPRCPGLRTD